MQDREEMFWRSKGETLQILRLEKRLRRKKLAYVALNVSVRGM